MNRAWKIELSFGLFALVLMVVVVVVFVVFRQPVAAPTITNTGPTSNPYQIGTTPVFTEIRTTSFVRSVPANNAVLAFEPNVVEIVFNDALGPQSAVIVRNKDNQPVNLGPGTISDDRLTLTVLIRKGVDGPLSVTYTACKIAGSCESGSFGFVVRPAL